MVVVKRFSSTKGFSQERLAREDIELLIEAMMNVEPGTLQASNTRIEMLIAKLNRMLK